MLLVPRQLMRVGMTGDVPYYGGRLSPAQAYAASHPRPTAPAAPPPQPAARRAARRTEDPLLALERLRESGVITQDEYVELRARVTR